MKSKIYLPNSSSMTNLLRAIRNLDRSLASPVTEPRDLSGIIKDFEMVYELSWKVLKKKLESDGITTRGPRDVFVSAYKNNYISHETIWLNMIADRNQTAHVYDENDALKIVERIRSDYLNIITATFAEEP